MPKPTYYLLTIQWRNWDRTVELYRSCAKAEKRVAAIAAENYPEDEGDLDRFSEHGHSWWIDEIQVIP